MVWSDPEIQKLSREFVTVAEEVHYIYPEGSSHLERLAGDPAHEFFKRYGQSVPEDDWNDPGTKQGIYMMGPEGEYLEGGGAISGNADAMKRRLRAALKRWQTLRREKGYANKPVPQVRSGSLPRIAKKSLVLRVFLRDLPRGERDDSGRRFQPADLRGRWLDFTKWAWNVNWIGFDDPSKLVPRSKDPEVVESELFRRVCREVLVDNVRGQNPRWRGTDVRLAELTMRVTKKRAQRIFIEYRGKAELRSEQQKFAPLLYGRAVWNSATEEFEAFDWVALGAREGAGTFNQRSTDPGPAPMGVLLTLFQPSAAPSEGPARRRENF